MTPEVPRKSQDLKVISNDARGSLPRHEKRKRPRISLSSEQFRLAATGKLFPVVDLSMDGMAFRVIDRVDLSILPIQTRIEGVLNLRGERIFVKGRVRRLTGNVVGVLFEELPEPTVRALERFLDPEVLGRELKPIPSSASLGTLWYHGPSGTDLLLHRGVDGQYRRFTLFLLGSYVQWEDDNPSERVAAQGAAQEIAHGISVGLSTGTARSSENRSDFRSEEWGIVQFETLVMTPDAAPDSQKLAVAKALILSSNLTQDLKKWCVRQMENATAPGASASDPAD